ncbi:5-oxopent-3-ene-1,2,5-tricarboxylate decarboxylase [Achromobacter sp. HZ01]|jgi:2-keto-4-pentenoate hydratase/2-oxohepta-3-ene-1,7-dioic acid hydratase in catechol pathway|uniref:fumarylacetoacetate hydrolase family protein n=1 Tax=Achromobacter sp. HZ01 TaxID=1416886 RepID=UPI000DC2F1AA|nr:fumarylacetoacetate hydrolase family protein [Achromobacter sp. HZ01]RAP65033.1 5-oxopent-3-ene-1,2,5-tricarboxylate decarboxylase [Achromobacter sp. HZ01]
MKLATFILDGQRHTGALTDKGLAVFNTEGDIGDLLRKGTDRAGFQALLDKSTRIADPEQVRFVQPSAEPPKIICIGLNYADHTKESPYEQPDYPTLFLRVATSTTGHGAVIERPMASEQLDYEGEMIVVLGKGGRHIPKDRALDCVFGYAVGNEVSVRDYQFKSPQWTVGKNFDGTGAWGPYIVTADELPPGGKGLKLQTRLNGRVVQDADTSDMIYDVASIVSIVSEAITLQAGDVIFSGTPAGVGLGHKPPLWMKDGDEVEVEIERIGLLRNTIRDERKG